MKSMTVVQAFKALEDIDDSVVTIKPKVKKTSVVKESLRDDETINKRTKLIEFMKRNYPDMKWRQLKESSIQVLDKDNKVLETFDLRKVDLDKDIKKSFKSEDVKVEKTVEKSLKESSSKSLMPVFDSRQSFYNKAKVVEKDDGSKVLYSYYTPVVRIKDGEAILLHKGYLGWNSSQTTLRHVKDFLRQNGFEIGSSKDLAKMYKQEQAKIDENLKESYEDLEINWNVICEDIINKVEEVLDVNISCSDIHFDDSRAWSLYVYGSKLGLPVKKFGAYRNYLGGGMRGSIEHNGREKDGTVELGEFFAKELEEIEDLINTEYYDESLKESSEDEKSKGEMIAEIIAKSLKGQCGPFGGEDPEVNRNEVTLYSQSAPETYRFNDDGSVDFVNIEEAVDSWIDDNIIEEDDRDYMISEYKHFDSINDLLSAGSSWFDNIKKKDKIKILAQSNLKESVNVDLNDKDEVKEVKDALDNEEKNSSVEKIVDVNADTIDKVKDSYLGNVIIRCVKCKTPFFKDPEELVKDENSEKYNVEEECPHCGNKEGFELVGQVAKLDAQDSLEEPQEDAEVSSEEEIKKEVKRPTEVEMSEKENAFESLKKVENLDETSFDKVINEYLTTVFENVESYKTTSSNMLDESLELEGTLKYKNNKEKTIKFVLEGYSKSKDTLRFTGMNESLASSKKAFNFNAKIKDNCLVCESLSYNYHVKLNEEYKVVKGKYFVK